MSILGEIPAVLIDRFHKTRWYWSIFHKQYEIFQSIVFSADVCGFALTKVHIQLSLWAFQVKVLDILLDLQLSVSILRAVVVHLSKDKVTLLEKGTKQQVLNGQL